MIDISSNCKDAEQHLNKSVQGGYGVSQTQLWTYNLAACEINPNRFCYLTGQHAQT